MTQMSKLLRASIALAALSLVACNTPITNGPEAGFDPNTRFPYIVQPQMMTLRLPSNVGLDQNTGAQLAHFAADYLDHGSGAVVVSASGRNRDAALDLADRLVDLGVQSDQIMVADQEDQSAPDSVKLTYIRYMAQTPPCGDFSMSQAYTESNRVPANFGCATQHNIAAQVADPRDLISPRSLSPDDAQRRLQVLDKYRKGEPTVTQRTQQQSGAISDVAGGM